MSSWIKIGTVRLNLAQVVSIEQTAATVVYVYTTAMNGDDSIAGPHTHRFDGDEAAALLAYVDSGLGLGARDILSMHRTALAAANGQAVVR